MPLPLITAICAAAARSTLHVVGALAVTLATLLGQYAGRMICCRQASAPLHPHHAPTHATCLAGESGEPVAEGEVPAEAPAEPAAEAAGEAAAPADGAPPAELDEARAALVEQIK